jgi:DNA-binding NarL/FixJ family response regulator
MGRENNRTAVILDRHPLWLDALDRLLANVGFVVVGRATEGDEALALIEAHAPDVFIAGINAASAEQVAVVRKAQQSQLDLKCVVVADSAELEAIEAAFAAGASVYCIRTAEEGDFASAIRQAFARSIYIAANGREPIPRSTTARPDSAAAQQLTRRELEILRLVAEGHSNSQLAHLLWVTEQTVKFHLSNIYRKLNVANRTEASRWAQLNGLLSNQPEQDVGGVASAA